MELSGLESANDIETKAVSAVPIWDHLGWFPPRLFPYCSRLPTRPISPAYAKPSLLTRDPIVATKFARRLNGILRRCRQQQEITSECRQISKDRFQQLGRKVTCPRWRLFVHVESPPLKSVNASPFQRTCSGNVYNSPFSRRRSGQHSRANPITSP